MLKTIWADMYTGIAIDDERNNDIRFLGDDYGILTFGNGDKIIEIDSNKLPNAAYIIEKADFIVNDPNYEKVYEQNGLILYKYNV